MFSLRVLLSFYLIFCQFQPGVAYKRVAYKKKHVALLVMIRSLESSITYLRRKTYPPIFGGKHSLNKPVGAINLIAYNR